MKTRVVIAVVTAVVLFGLYSWISTKDGDTFASPYATAYPVLAPPSPPATVPSGPSAPSQRAMRETVEMPEETAHDPSQDGYENAEHPDRLRHPERAFAPGLPNHSDDGQESGLASQAAHVTYQSAQMFGPERVQNGGAFLESGVMANDMTIPTGYSEV